MKPAEDDQIVQIGGTSVRPMFYVMTMSPSGPSATGEPTAPVPVVELTTQP
jgi:hypothetical protein